ncbi:hypothetical protein FE840_007810 [Peteryoungia desertarenae]|uniref:Uncharacterized protein n=1 Tax=Peteryoungia desertarenae TaxID=1813451 RepID=A0ABX6QMF3_9HYPH|nr:hypothetical protein [Peteryoungia desertarenae]QLF69457.1 hypothetical protein FE840_007810 [Peteryoungia desertarenae]
MNFQQDDTEPSQELQRKEVAEWVYKFLVESDEPTKPVLLSKLGGRITKEFGRPVRSLLGRDKTLSHVLTEHLEGKIGFIGSQGTLSVFVDESATARRDAPLPRLNKVLWAAFFRPIKEGERRFIRLAPEVHFWDAPEDSAAPSPGWEEIEPHRIPPVELPLPQRNRAAYSAIEDWFKLRGYSLQDHYHREDHPHAPRPTDVALPAKLPPSAPRTADSNGIEALRNLVLSIPEKDRKNYTINLDLLSALLQ